MPRICRVSFSIYGQRWSLSLRSAIELARTALAGSTWDLNTFGKRCRTGGHDPRVCKNLYCFHPLDWEAADWQNCLEDLIKLQNEPRGSTMSKFIPGVTGYVSAIKLGRLANGAERGKGTRMHALIGSYSDGITYGTAVCGASIGSHSAGWRCVDPLRAIDCPKCRKRVNKRR